MNAKSLKAGTGQDKHLSGITAEFMHRKTATPTSIEILCASTAGRCMMQTCFKFWKIVHHYSNDLIIKSTSISTPKQTWRCIIKTTWKKNRRPYSNCFTLTIVHLNTNSNCCKWAIQCRKHSDCMNSWAPLVPCLCLHSSSSFKAGILFPPLRSGERKNETRTAISMEYLSSIIAVLAICSLIHLFTFRVGRDSA